MGLRPRLLALGLLVASGAAVGTANGSIPVRAEPAAAAGVYFVSPGGNDANPGTKERPWRTVQHAADRLAAGETVYIRSGTYTEQVVPRRSGTPGAYITYAASPGEKPVVDGASLTLPAEQGLFEIRGRAYIRLSGLRVVNATDDHTGGIHVDRSHDIVLENNSTSNTRSSGIGVWTSRNVVVRGNRVARACTAGWQESLTVAGTDTFEIAGNTVQGIPGGKEGIDAKDGSRHGRIHGNLVYNVPTVGIYVDAWDKPTFDISVYGNVVRDVTRYDGIALASEMGGTLASIRVYNNVVYRSGAVGIAVTRNGDEGGRHPMRGIRVVNNTVWNNGRGWGGGIAIDNPEARNVLVRNNIVSGNRSFQLAVSAGTPNVVADHNLIDGYRGDREDGEIYGAAHVEGNPLFVNTRRGDFHLRRGSPAVDTGSAAGAPGTDFDGSARPRGTGYEIGAYEF